jgi:hypothetical protein
MIAANPVFNSLTSILNRPNPRLKASMALSRIMTQLDVRDLPYEQGVDTNRRQDGTRHVSIGVWLIPVEDNQSASSVETSNAVPVATCDLRRQGIGVLVPTAVRVRRFIVAVADQENVWRFFLTDVRHVSSRPGGWHQVGLDVAKTIDLESLQLLHFRNRVNSFASL